MWAPPRAARPILFSRSASNPRTYGLTRLIFQRAFALLYFLVFLGAFLQFRSLIGEHGLLPARLYLERVPFLANPSLFYLDRSDSFIAAVCMLGMALSLLAASGFSEKRGVAFSAAVWGLLWVFYLSIVNIGQTFWSFGWEIMMLETGFLAIFMGSEDVEPPKLIVWALRWELFRLMLGAGLIKLRGDACWRDFTCMYYYYETQPIPNPLSWYFHHQPHAFLRFQVLSTHVVELVAPWFYFVSGPPAWIAGILTTGFQGCLIVSGNLSWLNYLTVLITVACFDDRFLSRLFPWRVPAGARAGRGRQTVLACLACLLLFLSVQPAVNLFSPRQMMNTSFEPLHLVNSYGAFGSITKERTEIIFEGTDGEDPEHAEWKEYGFKAKPGDVHRMPGIVSPYHRRLDWLMWFAAMTTWRSYPWVLNFADKLLHNDAQTLRQIGDNPFPDRPPRFVRATMYAYRFTTPEEKKRTGDWWVREPIGVYLPPLSADSEPLRRILKQMEWD